MRFSKSGQHPRLDLLVERRAEVHQRHARAPSARGRAPPRPPSCRRRRPRRPARTPRGPRGRRASRAAASSPGHAEQVRRAEVAGGDHDGPRADRCRSSPPRRCVWTTNSPLGAGRRACTRSYWRTSSAEVARRPRDSRRAHRAASACRRRSRTASRRSTASRPWRRTSRTWDTRVIVLTTAPPSRRMRASPPRCAEIAAASPHGPAPTITTSAAVRVVRVRHHASPMIWSRRVPTLTYVIGVSASSLRSGRDSGARQRADPRACARRRWTCCQPSNHSYTGFARSSSIEIARKLLVQLAVHLVAGADRDPLERVEHVELGHREPGEPVHARRVAHDHRVEPAAAARAPGRRAELVAERAHLGSRAARRARWAAARCRRASCTPSPRRARRRSPWARCPRRWRRRPTSCCSTSRTDTCRGRRRAASPARPRAAPPRRVWLRAVNRRARRRPRAGAAAARAARAAPASRPRSRASPMPNAASCAFACAMPRSTQLAQPLGMAQVEHAHAAARDLVLVRRADAAPRRADRLARRALARPPACDRGARGARGRSRTAAPRRPRRRARARRSR